MGTDDEWRPGSYGGGVGVGDFDHWAWELRAPDGRVVSVGEAKAEIAEKERS